MTRDQGERRVSRKSDPELYEHLESLMFGGATDVELKGRTYNIARDKDERGDECYVLTPED